MPRFILTGDVTKAARVVAEGATADEAIKNAEAGKFTIYEEVNKEMSFSFDGDDDHIEPHDGPRTECSLCHKEVPTESIRLDREQHEICDDCWDERMR